MSGVGLVLDKYDAGLEYLSAEAPLDDIIYLIKCDGGVVLRSLISHEELDKTYDEIKDRMDKDTEWDGEFFPTRNFQAVCAELLTTRTTYWWGGKRKESVSKPYLTSGVAIEIGPGAKAQPLHCDSYLYHREVSAIDEWDNERDRNREVSIGLCVAGCRVTSENGGTQFIPGSHLWASTRAEPPALEDTITPTLEKGDAFLMLTSVLHGGGANTTTDQRRLVYFNFAVRGFLRQEKNQYLAVPRDIARQYDRATQQFMGYYISEPACGHVHQVDPIYVLNPELKGIDEKPKDF
ncbi:phytanoyl-CoA dioxygenase family protein [Aspergillus undulatus]|uniref:phytanoyl-CoA dioxygenase family protein n=1 Tax=Aspergillus undulatus TaxID=1810928 RepID=UPI003CCE0C58